MQAVAARGLVKHFGERAALDGVDVSVAAGQVHGLLGANGAGKTTLLRILFGLIAPDAGEVDLLGRSLAGAGSAALDGVAGFVEEPSFYPYLSGRANLALLARLDGGVPDGRIDEALERAGLADRADDRFAGYSTGMRQRLGLAAALLRAPRLLLLDEPTSGLDPGGARAVAALVRELAAAGVAILLSSHQIGELEKICDAYTMLRAGRVVWDGSAQQLLDAAPAAAHLLTTGDDARALDLARPRPGLRLTRSPRGGLELIAAADEVDAFVLALADERIPVRRLELLVSPLESLFFACSGDGASDGVAGTELVARALAGAAA